MEKRHERFAALSDPDLAAAVVDGEEGAVEYLLVEVCGSVLEYLCVRYPRAGLAYWDLVGEMFVLLQKHDWRALRAFQGRNRATNRTCRIKTYIRTCATRLLWRKSDKGVLEIDWTTALSDDEGRWIEVEDPRVPREQEMAQVMEAVGRIPNPLERLVLEEYKLNGRSAEDVAALIAPHTRSGKGTVGNVYTICNRALASLRRVLTGGDDDA